MKVRFSPSTARYVEEGFWHETQKLTRQKDGGLLAEFQLSTTEEVKRWVLGFGENAVVLEPESLRREMAEELRQMADAYVASAVTAEPEGARE